MNSFLFFCTSSGFDIDDYGLGTSFGSSSAFDSSSSDDTSISFEEEGGILSDEALGLVPTQDLPDASEIADISEEEEEKPPGIDLSDLTEKAGQKKDKASNKGKKGGAKTKGKQKPDLKNGKKSPVKKPGKPPRGKAPKQKAKNDKKQGNKNGMPAGGRDLTMLSKNEQAVLYRNGHMKKTLAKLPMSLGENKRVKTLVGWIYSLYKRYFELYLDQRIVDAKAVWWIVTACLGLFFCFIYWLLRYFYRYLNDMSLYGGSVEFDPTNEKEIFDPVQISVKACCKQMSQETNFNPDGAQAKIVRNSIDEWLERATSYYILTYINNILDCSIKPVNNITALNHYFNQSYFNQVMEDTNKVAYKFNLQGLSLSNCYFSHIQGVQKFWFEDFINKTPGNKAICSNPLINFNDAFYSLPDVSKFKNVFNNPVYKDIIKFFAFAAEHGICEKIPDTDPAEFVSVIEKVGFFYSEFNQLFFERILEHLNKIQQAKSAEDQNPKSLNDILNEKCSRNLFEKMTFFITTTSSGTVTNMDVSNSNKTLLYEEFSSISPFICEVDAQSYNEKYDPTKSKTLKIESLVLLSDDSFGYFYDGIIPPENDSFRSVAEGLSNNSFIKIGLSPQEQAILIGANKAQEAIHKSVSENINRFANKVGDFVMKNRRYIRSNKYDLEELVSLILNDNFFSKLAIGLEKNESLKIRKIIETESSSFYFFFLQFKKFAKYILSVKYFMCSEEDREKFSEEALEILKNLTLIQNALAYHTNKKQDGFYLEKVLFPSYLNEAVDVIVNGKARATKPAHVLEQEKKDADNNNKSAAVPPQQTTEGKKAKILRRKKKP